MQIHYDLEHLDKTLQRVLLSHFFSTEIGIYCLKKGANKYCY